MQFKCSNICFELVRKQWILCWLATIRRTHAHVHSDEHLVHWTGCPYVVQKVSSFSVRAVYNIRSVCYTVQSDSKNCGALRQEKINVLWKMKNKVHALLWIGDTLIKINWRRRRGKKSKNLLSIVHVDVHTWFELIVIVTELFRLF